MNYKIGEYPPEKYKFEIYDNKKRKTWQKIKEETGCYALVNLGYFGLVDFSIQDHIMVDGQWLRKPDWADNGILVDKDGRLTVGPDKEATWGYCRGEPCYLLRGNTPSRVQHYGRNGLTMLGVRKNGTVVILLVSKDEGISTRDGCTELSLLGCESILRFDGSWSSQGCLGPGMEVQPSQRRIVRTYMLIYKRETEDEDTSNIKQQYMTNNPCYTKWKEWKTIAPRGIMVHSTASPGVTAQDLRDKWDNKDAEVSVHAFIDQKETIQALPWNARAWHAGAAKKGGPTANDTHISFEVCEPQECRLIPIEWRNLRKGSKGWAVTQVQRELIARNYDPKGVDGSFGAGCEAAVKKFQRDAGLSVDGSVGPATRQALAGRMGSYLQYDPKETEDYFKAVWERAVTLCAHLCREYGFDPEKNILCHQEGYRKGIASNHADVNHWWPIHGKSMDDFRAAVKDKLNGVKTITCPNCGEVIKL